MVKNKKFLLLAASIVVLLAYFVMAAAGDEVKILSPASGTNYTNITSQIFNVSFVNGSDIIQPTNASFYLNISGSWTEINLTSCQVGATTSSCAANVSSPLVAISDGVYSINATIRNASTSISIIHTANLSNMVYVDSSRPIIFSSNISGPSLGTNYSQNLVLNVSAIDLVTGIANLFFNITNSSGQQNSTVTATREGTASSYSVTINTTGYPDGNYTITVYANDSVGNLNNTAAFYNVTLDNTKPAITHSCDDLVVEEDDVITCTCTGSDITSGIRSTDYTSNPSTSNTGTNFQTTCTVEDRAGNTNVSRIYYNVTGITGGTTSSTSGGSSGGTTSGTTTGSTTTNSTNSTTTNSTATSSNSSANLLEGNQEEQGANNVKINYWVIFIIIIVVAIAVTVFILFKKGIIQKLIKYNKPRPSN